MFAFDWRLGLLGAGWNWTGGGLVVVVRVVQIHDANRNKNNWRVDKWTAKGDFFNSSKESLARKDAIFSRR